MSETGEDLKCSWSRQIIKSNSKTLIQIFDVFLNLHFNETKIMN